MKAFFKGYTGEVVIIEGRKLFYTLDPAAKGNLWKNRGQYKIIEAIPEEAYCWWLHHNDAVIVYNERRRLI